MHDAITKVSSPNFAWFRVRDHKAYAAAGSVSTGNQFAVKLTQIALQVLFKAERTGAVALAAAAVYVGLQQIWECCFIRHVWVAGAKAGRVESADWTSAKLVVLVVVVAVAVLEVLNPGVVARVLRRVGLSMLLHRRQLPISAAAVQVLRAPGGAAVTLVHLAVGCWPSGPTRFKSARAQQP